MSNTAIDAGPIVAALSPLVNAAVSGFVIGVGGLLFAFLARVTGIAFAPDFQAQVERAAATQAGIIVAKAEGNLAGVSLDVRYPAIAAATNWLSANMPNLLTKAGLSRDDVSHLILSEIGRLQARMTGPAAPLSTAKKP